MRKKEVVMDMDNALKFETRPCPGKMNLAQWCAWRAAENAHLVTQFKNFAVGLLSCSDPDVDEEIVEIQCEMQLRESIPLLFESAEVILARATQAIRELGK